LVAQLRRIEQAVERQGLFAAGFLSYEAASAFDSGLTVCEDSGCFPLMWFGLYRQSRPVDLPSYGKPLNVYMSLPARQWLDTLLAVMYEKDLEEQQQFNEQFRMHGLQYFQRYQIGELMIETLKAEHLVRGGEESAMNYLIHLPDGCHLLYALDTGWFPDETWTFLNQKRIDILILDCTFGARTDRPAYPVGHLDMTSFVKMLERMADIRAIHEHTRIFASHINPHQGVLHDGMQERFNETRFNVTVAYDGLRLSS